MAATPKPVRKAIKTQKKIVEQYKKDKSSGVPFKKRTEKAEKKINTLKKIKHKNFKHTTVL